jgi:hypothetical protein
MHGGQQAAADSACHLGHNCKDLICWPTKEITGSLQKNVDSLRGKVITERPSRFLGSPENLAARLANDADQHVRRQERMLQSQVIL